MLRESFAVIESDIDHFLYHITEGPSDNDACILLEP